MDEAAPQGPSDLEADPEGWDTPPRRPHDPDGAPVLAAGGFEGPLDWLVDMARARKIDLLRVPVLALIEAFVAALTEALPGAALGAEPGSVQEHGDSGRLRPGFDLARWGNWLVMAADLTLLRSRLLAPVGAAEAAEATRAAELLRRQVVGRAEMAATAIWLDRRVQLGREVFARGTPVDSTGLRGARTADVVGLLRACLVALALPTDAADVYRPPGPPLWSVAQATARIRSLLPELGEADGDLGVFLPRVAVDVPERERQCRVAVASTFLAALELARNGVLGIDTSGTSVRMRAAAS
jgi:segregation and condensation protein A